MRATAVLVDGFDLLTELIVDCLDGATVVEDGFDTLIKFVVKILSDLSQGISLLGKVTISIVFERSCIIKCIRGVYSLALVS